MKIYVRIIQLLIVVALFLLLFWIIPAIIMVEIEDDWDLITAIYFCFITITTVGLGMSLLHLLKIGLFQKKLYMEVQDNDSSVDTTPGH